jgi:hypothetical protein
VANVILLIGDDDPAAARRDKHKIGMRHAQPFAAVRPDFIRYERRGSIELPDGFNQHGAEKGDAIARLAHGREGVGSTHRFRV